MIVNAEADSVSLPRPIKSTVFQGFSKRAARGYRRDDDTSFVGSCETVTGAKVVEPQNDTTAILTSSESSQWCLGRRVPGRAAFIRLGESSVLWLPYRLHSDQPGIKVCYHYHRPFLLSLAFEPISLGAHRNL